MHFLSRLGASTGSVSDNLLGVLWLKLLPSQVLCAFLPFWFSCAYLHSSGGGLLLDQYLFEVKG